MRGPVRRRPRRGRRRAGLLLIAAAVLLAVLAPWLSSVTRGWSGSHRASASGSTPTSRTPSAPAGASSSGRPRATVAGPAAAEGAPSDAAVARDATRPAVPPHLSVVALGDSVPSGYNCSCRPFPQLVGDGLRHDGTGVSVDNLAQPGETAAGLAQQLATSGSTRSAVAGADVVLVEIGANDLLDTRGQLQDDECPGGGISCYDDALHQMGQSVRQVLDRVRQLRGGQPTEVLVLDYWAVFEDGQVARSQTGEQGLVTDDQVTLAANVEICAAAQAAHDTCVDVRPAFRDIDGSADATPLLAPDGDHPNASGHQAIAQTVLGVLRPMLAAD